MILALTKPEMKLYLAIKLIKLPSLGYPEDLLQVRGDLLVPRDPATPLSSSGSVGTPVQPRGKG